MTGFSLAGRTAVVTGAVGRLGPIWVSSLLNAGATVSAWVLPGSDNGVFAATPEVQVVEADVTDRSSLESALAAVLDRHGLPDVLVNNAGIDQPPSGAGGGTLIQNIDARGFLKVLEINTLGAFQATQVVGGAMLGGHGGSIVNIGSLYASVSPDARMYDHLQMDPPFVKPPAYGASKAGLVNLTRFFATHWAPYGVRVNALSPGGVAGGQDDAFVQKFSSRVPLGRLANDSDLAGPLVFLASEASAYVTGIELKVDGGFTAW